MLTCAKVAKNKELMNLQFLVYSFYKNYMTENFNKRIKDRHPITFKN